MNNIPKEILDFAGSAALGDVSEKIGNQHGLLIDQIGELDAQIRHVLRGFSKAADFTSDLMKYVEINRETAEKITIDVNREVFQKLKEHMQRNSTPTQVVSEDFSAIEKAGGFSVERSTVNETANNIDESTMENRAHLLDGIEHPVSGSEKISRKETGSFTSSQSNPHFEPLVDQLLNGSVAQPQQKIVANPVPAAQSPAPTTPSTPTPVPAPKKGPDSYREPIN